MVTYRVRDIIGKYFNKLKSDEVDHVAEPYNIQSIKLQRNLKAKVVAGIKSKSSLPLSKCIKLNPEFSLIRDYAGHISKIDSQFPHENIYFAGRIDDSAKGSREAVEVLTRTARTGRSVFLNASVCLLFATASFSIDKEDIRVATLHLAKTAYRLGESVTGVVEMNRRGMSSVNILKVGATSQNLRISPSCSL